MNLQQDHCSSSVRERGCRLTPPSGLLWKELEPTMLLLWNNGGESMGHPQGQQAGPTTTNQGWSDRYRIDGPGVVASLYGEPPTPGGRGWCVWDVSLAHTPRLSPLFAAAATAGLCCTGSVIPGCHSAQPRFPPPILGSGDRGKKKSQVGLSMVPGRNSTETPDGGCTWGSEAKIGPPKLL